MKLDKAFKLIIRQKNISEKILINQKKQNILIEKQAALVQQSELVIRQMRILNKHKG